MRGVDHHICPGLQGLHQYPFLANRLFQRVCPAQQRMAAPGLLITLNDHLRRGLQKQHPALALHGLELVQHVKKLGKGGGGAHVVYQGHPVISSATSRAELREF